MTTRRFPAFVHERSSEPELSPRAQSRQAIVQSLNSPITGFHRARRKEISFEPVHPPAGFHCILQSGRQFRPAPCGATSRLQRAFANSPADDAPPPGGTGIPLRGNERGLSFPPPSSLPPEHLRPISRQCHYDSEKSSPADFGTRFRRPNALPLPRGKPATIGLNFALRTVGQEHYPISAAAIELTSYFNIPANVFANVWTSPGHLAET